MTELINEIKRFPGKGFTVLRVLLMFTLFAVSLPVLSQNITVKGTVTDSQTGETMIGLNVVIKGTVRGVVTDLDGIYTLSDCPPDATLVFSYVGYEPLEIAVQGRTTVDVAINPSSSMLEEIVVIGYGTVNRRDITGSVSSVQGKDLTKIPVSTAAEALTGKMAGVQVVTTEGSPDAEINIRIRGGGSITQDNSPLYIVDGFPVTSISDIPPSEIQSIDVLKDASSTAIYGARGANGVIILTTKGAVGGKTRVNYNTYYGFKKVADHLTSLGVEDYVKWQYEYALLSDNLDNYEKYFGLYQDIDLFSGQPSTKWYDQIFGHIGKTFNHDLNVTGGTEKLKYAAGYAGINSDEIMLGSEYKRDNISFKLDHNPNDRVGLSFNLRYSDTRIYGAGTTDQAGGTPTDSRVKQTMIFGPIPFTAMGEYADEEVSSSMVNPLDNVRDNDRQQFRKRYNLGASFSWEIVDNLEFRTEAGLDYNINSDDRFFGITTYYVKNTPSATYQNMPALESSESKSVGLRSTNTLNYDFKQLFEGLGHSLKLLVGQEVIVTESNTMFNQIWGFPTFFISDQVYKLVSQGVSNRFTNTYNPDNKLLSFFGRVNYDFKSRYLFTATFRADGSSKFSEGNRWGYFPSVAVAWRISEEEFMKNISSTLNNLKIRFSYGTAGNNNIPSGQIAQIFNAGSTSWISGFTSFWSPSTTMANPDLKWETTYTRNAGLDFGLFKGRISGNIELYLNTTKDLLINFPVSGSGYNTQYRNMGETENRGFELALNAVILNRESLGLNFGFNIGFNNNKIVSLGTMNDFGQATGWASTEISNDYWVSKGGSVGEMYGYISDGRYEVSDFTYDAGTETWTLNAGVADAAAVVGTLRPGTMKLKDLTGDGFVTIEDCALIGDANPKHTGGFNINATSYGFDLSAVFSWSYGNNIYNANKVEYTTARYQFRNMIDIMADGKRWTNIDSEGNLVNDPATLEALNTNTTMWSPYMTRHVFSDWAVEDGSYLRLNTISLGYTLPSQIVQKAHIQNLRFYVSGSNVFILTNYSGFDPEVSSRRNTVLTPGLDYSAYPKSRQILFGLNLNF
ncbi:MAG: SusC/RagA family protein [Bacteroidetes bacterium RBG_13_43_22]|nr:MAG: SusC/RagA family protein [Bacteroidetes bacterium RBG_13_43_22]